MAFVHLQVHSEFSVLKSSARLNGILAAAANDNAPAVALTDHGAMFGILEIQTRGKEMNKARKEKGLPPVKTIYGCHVYVDSPSATVKDPVTYERLTLLVENETGYYNLLRIVSYRYEESDRWAEIPSVPLDVVNQHKEGIINSFVLLSFSNSFSSVSASSFFKRSHSSGRLMVFCSVAVSCDKIPEFFMVDSI